MKQAIEVIQLLLAFSTLLNLCQQFEELVRKWLTGEIFLAIKSLIISLCLSVSVVKSRAF
jgi:hypothetical protein